MDSLRALCPRGTLSSCTQRPPVHTWHLASCSSDRNKRPLKERSNASFEKHRELLQAPRLKKRKCIPKERWKKKKRCPSYQSRARMCESLGKRRDCVVSKRPVRGFWDETTRRGDRQLPPPDAKCPRQRCVPTIDEVEQKTKLAASLTTQHKLSLPLISS